MGANQFKEEVSDAQKLAKDFTAAFVKNYALMYTVGLMESEQRAARKAANKPKWVLDKCDYKAQNPNGQEGHLLKKGAVMNKWRDRKFVVRGNSLIDFYLTEEDEQKGKKRGTLNLGAYQRVVDDPNEHGWRKIVSICEKAGMDLDSVPKPDPYAPGTILVEHDRKQTLCLRVVPEGGGEFDDKNEEHMKLMKQWVKTLNRCRHFSPALDVDDDPIHNKIFRSVLWRTRWDVGMWGWFSSGGGEVNMIADCIGDNIEWQILGRIDGKLSKIPGGWPVRRKARNTFVQQLDTFATTAVKPAWAAAYEAAKKVRDPAREEIKKLMQPINDAQTTIIEEINKLVESVAKDALNDKVTPHLQPLLELLFAPIITSMKHVMAAFDVSLAQGKEKYEKHEKHHYMVSKHWHSREFWAAERVLWDLYDILWDMRRVFDDVSPWGILHKARRRCQKLLLNALYTFESMLDAGKSWEEAQTEVKGLLLKDCTTAVAQIAGRMLEGVVDGLWTTVVVKPSKKLISPLSEKVPSAVKNFVDPDRLLEAVLQSVLRNSCMMVFEPFAAKVKFDE